MTDPNLDKIKRAKTVLFGCCQNVLNKGYFSPQLDKSLDLVEKDLKLFGATALGAVGSAYFTQIVERIQSLRAFSNLFIKGGKDDYALAVSKQYAIQVKFLVEQIDKRYRSEEEILYGYITDDEVSKRFVDTDQADLSANGSTTSTTSNLTLNVEKTQIISGGVNTNSAKKTALSPLDPKSPHTTNDPNMIKYLTGKNSYRSTEQKSNEDSAKQGSSKEIKQEPLSKEKSNEDSAKQPTSKAPTPANKYSLLKIKQEPMSEEKGGVKRKLVTSPEASGSQGKITKRVSGGNGDKGNPGGPAATSTPKDGNCQGSKIDGKRVKQRAGDKGDKLIDEVKIE